MKTTRRGFFGWVTGTLGAVGLVTARSPTWGGEDRSVGPSLGIVLVGDDGTRKHIQWRHPLTPRIIVPYVHRTRNYTVSEFQFTWTKTKGLYPIYTSRDLGSGAALEYIT